MLMPGLGSGTLRCLTHGGVIKVWWVLEKGPQSESSSSLTCVTE